MSGQWWESNLIVGPFANITEANAWAAANPSSLFLGLLATSNGQQISWRGAGVGWVDGLGNRLLATGAARSANAAIVQQAIVSSGCVNDYLSASESNESWANTSAWTLGANPMQVSGGKLYAGATQGAGSWAYKPFGGIKRIRTSITTGSALGGGFVFIGVGGANPVSLAGCYGVSINNANAQIWSNGAASVVTDFVVAANKTYDVDVCVYADNTASFTLAESGKIQGITHTATISAATGIVIFNASAGALSGTSVNPVDMKGAIAPMRTAVGPSGITRFHSSSLLTWGGAILHLPSGFSANKRYRIVVMFHGNGTDEYSWSNLPVTDSKYPKVALDLVSNGYVCLCVSESLKTSWGRNSSIEAYKAALIWASAYVKIGCVLAFANSMGGIESLNAINQGAIPALANYITSGTANLANCYSNALFTSIINFAYSISGDYSEKTADHDPMFFDRKNIMACAYSWATATDDAAVDPVNNSQLLDAQMKASAIQSEIELTTGGHSFDYGAPAWMAKVRAFYDRFSP